MNRLVRTTYADGSSTSTEYDPAGRTVASVDENGHRTAYEYDELGRRVAVVDALGNLTQFGFDARGHRTSVTDALGVATQLDYVELGRNTRTLFADGTVMLNGYDALGRLVAKTDQAGVVTGYLYDALGRLTGVDDALGGQTRYGYDKVGNKISQTDPNGHVTTWKHDDLGRVVEHCLPLGQYESFAYDPSGNVTQQTTFNGEMIVKSYDINNRRAAKDIGNGQQVSFSYTATGQMDVVTDHRGATDHDYDNRDRLTRVTNPDGSWLSYSYDSRGNRASVAHAGGTTAYSFDALNRIATVTDPDGQVTSYTYLATGQQRTAALPNGIVTTNSYDQLGRLTLIEHRRGDGSLVASYQYLLGLTGNRTDVFEVHNGRSVHYAYDDLYRLTEEAIVVPVNGDRNIACTYDAFGNRLLKSDTVEGVTSYTYDANDRLITETRPDGVYTYSYDDNGNTTGEVGPVVSKVYGWTAENRLVSFDDGSNAVLFEYDDGGLRTKKVVNASDVTGFLVDKNRQYGQVLVESDWLGSTLASYVHANDLVSIERSGAGSFYLVDGQLSTRALSDDVGAVTDTYTYEAFGSKLSSSGTSENLYRYAGEQIDEELGDYYFRARYYNPMNGRFDSRDKHIGYISATSTLNKYTYADGDPIRRADPSGEFANLTEASIAISISIALSALSGCRSSRELPRWAAKYLTDNDAAITAAKLLHSENGTIEYAVWVTVASGGGYTFTWPPIPGTPDDVEPGRQQPGYISVIHSHTADGACGFSHKDEELFWDMLGWGTAYKEWVVGASAGCGWIEMFDPSSPITYDDSTTPPTPQLPITIITTNINDVGWPKRIGYVR
ncbi:MAG: RHS repeat-associated core domain-containing protein [Pseudomonadota bacterium]